MYSAGVAMKFDKQPDEPEPMRRVVEIKWLPRSDRQWATFTAARISTANLWNAMIALHARIRRFHRLKWPTIARWQQWAKGKFPNLAAQSVQSTVMEFCECLNATTAKRKWQMSRGEEVTTRYPHNTKQYRAPTYTNQTATIKDGFLRLGHGGGQGQNKLANMRALRIRLPFELPGRLMQVSLGYGIVRIVCEVPGTNVAEETTTPETPEPPVEVTHTGNDVGVNTILAATDGITAVVVSGKEAKAIVQYRNKKNASLKSKISRCKHGSRRAKRLLRRKHRMLDKCGRKIKDIAHKATAAVVKQFPNVKAFVGESFNDGAKKLGRVQAQQVSQVVSGKIIKQLKYKSPGTKVIPEPDTSRTCPVCGHRRKCRGRVYRCGNRKCGLVAPRDVVGAVNIRCLGIHGELRKHQPMPTTVKFVRPLRKYRGGGYPPPRSSSGTLASSSRTKAQCAP